MRNAFIAGIVAALVWSVSPAPAQAPQVGGVPSPARPSLGPPTRPADSVAKPALIDINRASREELDQLPGVGPARAEAIIKGRPYKSKDELLRKKILPSGVYEGIKDRIIARQA